MVFKPGMKTNVMKGYLTLTGHYFQKAILFFTGMMVAIVTLAQDKKEIDVNVNSNKNNFWGQPWIWVVGAAVFILLLVAILRGGRRRDV
jgi:putative Mn2+ efflux pump MntP